MRTAAVVTAHRFLLEALRQPLVIDRLVELADQRPDWQELFDQALRHDLLPLLHLACKQLPEAAIPTEQRVILRDVVAGATLRGLQMQKELRRIVELLTAGQIPVIPYKGPILAEEVYGDIGLRCFNDLDLLVPPECARDAVQILIDQGFNHGLELPEERWSGLQKTLNHLHLLHPEYDWGVEIHWELFHPMYVLPFDLSDHWAGLKPGQEGRLESEETLVMLCAHGTKHLWEQLKWLVDIDRLLRSDHRLYWERTLFLARRSGSVRALLLGLDLSQTLCGTPLSDEMLEEIDGDPIVQSLTRDVIDHLFPENPEQKDFVREYSFYLKCRENAVDRWRQVLRWLFWPRQSDWEIFPLGDRWYRLYHVERPVRMVWKWVFKPALCRLGVLRNQD
jgi:hypothetical protein